MNARLQTPPRRVKRIRTLPIIGLAVIPLVAVAATATAAAADAGPAKTPDGVRFPSARWETMTPEEAGLDREKSNFWVDRQRPRFGPASGGQQPGSSSIRL